MRHRYKVEARLDQLQARRRGNARVSGGESRQDTQFCDTKPTASVEPQVQRIRSGEQLPSPAVVDVSVHASTSSLPEPLERSADTGMANSVPAALEQPKPRSGDVDVDGHANAGIVDSVSGALEQLKDIPGDEDGAITKRTQ